MDSKKQELIDLIKHLEETDYGVDDRHDTEYIEFRYVDIELLIEALRHYMEALFGGNNDQT